MTDRINYLTVALERDIRDDDVEPLITAIKMLRGVRAVKANVADGTGWTAEARVRAALQKKLWDTLHDDWSAA